MSGTFMSAIKKFDVHYKTPESVNEKTVIGAILTVISTILVFVLIISEFYYYYQINVDNLMVTDTQAVREPTVLEFEISFPYIKCSNIKFVQDVTRGTLHTNQPDYFNKEDINDGCKITGIIATDRIGGNFRIEYYNENLDHHLKESSLQTQKNLNTDPHENPVDQLMKETELYHKLLDDIDTSHNIEYFYFHSTAIGGDQYSDTKNVLKQKVQTIPKGPSIHQYVINVVHSQYIKLNHNILNTNEYSVTERHVDADQKAYVQSLGGSLLINEDFTGVMFTYDFLPVMIVKKEVRESIFEFLANLCGIVGGFITVLM